jgi:hypothetical protein
MILLKKGLGLSIIGISIFVLMVSFWNSNREEALIDGQDWTDAVHLEFDENNEVIIDRDNFNFQVQGQGVVQAVYEPISWTFTRATIFYDAVAGFFGLKSENLEQIIQDNNTLYGNLKDVYLDQTWTIDYENGGVYTFYIDISQSLYYNTLYESYNLNTYTTFLGIRLWRTESIQIDYDTLDDLNSIYGWV